MNKIIFYLVNNSRALQLEGLCKKHPIATVVIYLTIYLIFPAFYYIVLVYLLALVAFNLYWKAYSTKLGLKSLFLIPTSRYVLEKAAQKEGVDLSLKESGMIWELHVVNLRFGSTKAYLKAVNEDMETLQKLQGEGFFDNSSIVGNTFNTGLIKKGQKVFSGKVYQGVCLFKSNLLFTPSKFKKLQSKMFGKVVSNKNVASANHWDLLVINS